MELGCAWILRVRRLSRKDPSEKGGLNCRTVAPGWDSALCRLRCENDQANVIHMTSWVPYVGISVFRTLDGPICCQKSHPFESRARIIVRRIHEWNKFTATLKISFIVDLERLFASVASRVTRRTSVAPGAAERHRELFTGMFPESRVRITEVTKTSVVWC